MQRILTIEFAALFALAILLFSALPFPWWWFPLLFLVPDVSMIGYLAGPRAGAITYNLVHTLTFGIAVYIAGYLAHAAAVELAGAVLIGHSAFDRVVGYGLKYPDSFAHTHLGDL